MVFSPSGPYPVVEGVERPIPLQIRLPVLGVPVIFEVDAQALCDAVENALGSWRALGVEPEPESAPRATARVQLRLGEDHGSGNGSITLTSAPPARVSLRGPGVHGHADGAALTASCTISPAVLKDRYVFEEIVLPTLVLRLTSCLDRQPLHAAALGRGDRTLLLHGRSGAGKSTLAYAAFRNGWNVPTDDVVFLQSKPELRVWALAPRMHLPPDAADWFPELAQRRVVRRQNGKMKFLVEPLEPTAPRPVQHAVLCLLERGGGEADAQRIDAGVAVARVLDSLDAGFDEYRDTIGPVLRTLIGEYAWIVYTARDPRRTLSVLDQLLRT